MHRWSVLAIAPFIASCGSDPGFTEEDFEPKFAEVQFVNLLYDSDVINVDVNEVDDVNVGSELAEPLQFRQATEERSLPAPVNYVYSFSYVDDQDETRYLADEIEIRVEDEDQLYFIYSGSLANPITTEVRFIDPETDDSELNSGQVEIWMFHGATIEEELEVYLTGISAPLSTSFPLASLTPNSVTPGVIVTHLNQFRLRVLSGQTGDLLFDSSEVELIRGSRNLIALVDHFGPIDRDAFDAEQIDARIVANLGSESLQNDEAPTELRVVNLTSGLGNLDVYLGSPSDGPDFPNLGRLDITEYQNVETGSTSLNVTLENVQDQFVLERDLDLLSGRFGTLVLAGSPETEITATLTFTEPRPILNRVSTTLINSSEQVSPLNFYFLEPGQTAPTSSPQAILASAQQQTITIAPGTYDLVITDESISNELYGPVRVVLEQNFAYNFIVVEEELVEAAFLTVIQLEDPAT